MLSYILGVSGAVNYLLAIKGRIEGLWLGLINQFFWVAYALGSHEYGFFFTVALFGPINIYGLVNHFKKKRDSGPAPKRGREYCD
jgi:hypothetical protein